MAKKILKNVSITVNAVEVGNQFREIAIETERDEVEVTGFQAANKEYLPGLGDGTITGEAFVDYGASSIDATFWPLSKQDTPFPVVIKPDTGVVSATNPSYTMQALMYGFSPIAGAVGEAATTEITFRNADETGIVRAIA
jgi:hypothetical protein